MAISIGDVLGGLGAAIGGTGPQYVQGLRQREQQMTERKRAELEARQKAMYQDAGAAFQLLQTGDLDGIIRLGQDRLEMLKTFPDADPSDTVRVVQNAINAKAGDPMALRELATELTSAAARGRAMGYTQAPAAIRGVEVDGSIINPVTGDVIYQGQPKQPDQFAVMTAEEVAAAGLPAGAYTKNVATGKVSAIGGGGTVVNVGQATEAERTAGILAERLDFAQSQINDVLSMAPEAERPQAGSTALSALGLDYLARVANPAERQIIEAAQTDMLDAALTLGTGAAYTREQLVGYRQAYFPQLGDDEQTVKAKSQRLQNLIQAAYKKAGRAAPETIRSAGAQASQAPQSWIDLGLDANDWNALSPQDKQSYMAEE